VVALSKDGKLTAPAKERICFQPHPKTLTMAGDYEYFAAQVCRLLPWTLISDCCLTEVRPCAGPPSFRVRSGRVY
jgi:hypothetical protein